MTTETVRIEEVAKVLGTSRTTTCATVKRGNIHIIRIVKLKLGLHLMLFKASALMHRTSYAFLAAILLALIYLLPPPMLNGSYERDLPGLAVVVNYKGNLEVAIKASRKKSAHKPIRTVIDAQPAHKVAF